MKEYYTNKQHYSLHQALLTFKQHSSLIEFHSKLSLFTDKPHTHTHKHIIILTYIRLHIFSWHISCLDTTSRLAVVSLSRNRHRSITDGSKPELWDWCSVNRNHDPWTTYGYVAMVNTLYPRTAYLSNITVSELYPEPVFLPLNRRVCRESSPVPLGRRALGPAGLPANGPV